MIEEIKNSLVKEFGEVVEILSEGLQDTLLVDSNSLLKICFWLRDNPTYYFDFLSNITAVDYYPKSKFALVYNLSSIPYQKQITIKVILEHGRDTSDLPEIESVSSVWKTADWHEREAYDLMGIFFVGHSDLRRILLPDDWEGFPLRKDYKEAESYHGISIKG